MPDKVIHLSHCVYSNNEINYEWAKEVAQDFHELPNLYAISLIRVNGGVREALSTVVVKTNLGQEKEETEKIYKAMTSTFPKLQNLPTQNVRLVSTKANLSSNAIPSESDLLTIMTDMYTQNAVAGNA
jgi:hypothetical protein